jgi:hypothetical protein
VISLSESSKSALRDCSHMSQGFIRCPVSCEEEKCACSCPAHLHDGLTPYEVMKDEAKIMVRRLFAIVNVANNYLVSSG